MKPHSVFSYFLLLYQFNQSGTSINRLSLGPFSDPRGGEGKEIPHEVECVIHYLSPDDSIKSHPKSNNGIPDQEAHLPSPSTPTFADSTPGCECIPFYLCNSNGTLSQDKEDVDMRSAFLSSVGLVSTPPYKPCSCSKATLNPKPGSGMCGNYLDVCCKPVQPQPSIPPMRDDPVSDSLPNPPTACGRQNLPVLDPRVSKPSGDVQFGEFPWMVAILGDRTINGRSERFYFCGGSLINPSVVLTAAHCVKGKRGLIVRAGEWDSTLYGQLYSAQERRVHHVVIHEEYYAGALYNDIALLFLQAKLHLAPNIGLVCLPREGETLDSKHCVASGWGTDAAENDGKYSVILKKVELPLISRDRCQDILRSTRLGRYFLLHESFMCAGGQSGKDTCKGDGGSPLVCRTREDPSVFVQVGIVSWGIGCGSGIPAAYVDVAYFQPWIQSQISVLNLDNRFGPVQER